MQSMLMWTLVASLGVGLVALAPMLTPAEVVPDGLAAYILPLGYFLALGGVAGIVIAWMRSRGR